MVEMEAVTGACYIQLCVIIKCVLKGQHCYIGKYKRFSTSKCICTKLQIIKRQTDLIVYNDKAHVIEFTADNYEKVITDLKAFGMTSFNAAFTKVNRVITEAGMLVSILKLCVQLLLMNLTFCLFHRIEQNICLVTHRLRISRYYNSKRSICKISSKTTLQT